MYEDDDKPTPADSEGMPWLIAAFICFMLIMMGIKTYFS